MRPVQVGEPGREEDRESDGSTSDSRNRCGTKQKPQRQRQEDRIGELEGLQWIRADRLQPCIEGWDDQRVEEEVKWIDGAVNRRPR